MGIVGQDSKFPIYKVKNGVKKLDTAQETKIRLRTILTPFHRLLSSVLATTVLKLYRNTSKNGRKTDMRKVLDFVSFDNEASRIDPSASPVAQRAPCSASCGTFFGRVLGSSWYLFHRSAQKVS